MPKLVVQKFWITICGFMLILMNHRTSGQSEFEVQLVVRKYVEKGSSVTLRCDHNVKPEILYKVTWLKGGNKIFEYINGRNPPFRNFTIQGGLIDWKASNERQVTLKDVDFEASGLYYCEVSTDTPIFTKPSQDEQVHVILPQTGPPRISFSKRQFFIGENLVANCTTSKSRPAPHITWLINGKKVDDKHIRTFFPYASSSGGKNTHRSKVQQHPNNPSYDRVDLATDTFPKSPTQTKDRHEVSSHIPRTQNFDTFSASSRSFGFGGNFEAVPAKDIHSDFYDNKYHEARKHRNGRKYRRSFGEGGVVRNPHRPVFSASQLSVEVSNLHAGSNGRLEITCLATIPAHVGPGEQFADYKTYSVKIDIEQAEVTSPVPQPAPLGNISSSATLFTINTLVVGVPIAFVIIQQKCQRL
ncbi:uncharacterized protein LOC129799383 [Phlebotomus papatasi]|uniref:uncharacterized protein LOC129799383 n=1 Tax=Phlebotomus papatasi TaxID=29031 RepID=UPI00248398C4|nr:uncharacterized protein LOC129799383 [Phlebotomus papatasi]